MWCVACEQWCIAWPCACRGLVGWLLIGVSDTRFECVLMMGPKEGEGAVLVGIQGGEPVGWFVAGVKVFWGRL